MWSPASNPETHLEPDATIPPSSLTENETLLHTDHTVRFHGTLQERETVNLVMLIYCGGDLVHHLKFTPLILWGLFTVVRTVGNVKGKGRSLTSGSPC